MGKHESAGSTEGKAWAVPKSGPAPVKSGPAPVKKAEPELIKNLLATIEPPEKLPVKRSPIYWVAGLLLTFGVVGGGAAYLLSDQALENHGAVAQQARNIRSEILLWLGLETPATPQEPQSPALEENNEAVVWTPSAPPEEAATKTAPEMPPGADAPSVAELATGEISPPAEPIAETEPEPAPQDTTIELPGTSDDSGTLVASIDEVAPAAADSDSADLLTETDSPAEVETLSAPASGGADTAQFATETLQVLFAYRSMEIQPEFAELLSEVAGKLENSPSLVARVVGIVENRGSAPSDINRRVSTQRAQIVANYLEGLGVSGERLFVEEDSSLLEAERGGARRPERVVEVTLHRLSE